MADQSAWQSPPKEVVHLGHYRILAELARGGMAAVFLGIREPRQQAPSRELQELVAAGRFDADPRLVAAMVEGAADIAALKQIHPHLAHDPDFVAMLMDEARIATRIHHPNVVEIREYRLGEQDGTNFIAMEYVAGESLSTLMRAAGNRGVRFSPAMAASVCADVAGALHTAHELKGVNGESLELVHRDVSPQNVLIRYDGRVKLTDFGVAKAVGRLQRTQPGEIKGKLAYMAPEQAYGRAVDRRSDVYSLGVVLYELALGRRLFGGKSDAETVRNIMQHNVPAPRSVDPGFPAGLEEIVLGMLQADPSQRFQSAGAVERALRAFVQSSGEGDIDGRLGEMSRALEPARYRAKTELVLRELASMRQAPDNDHGARTMVTSSRPPRVATQAAPKARTATAPSPPAPEPAPGGWDASEARTVPLSAQARAAVSAVAGVAPGTGTLVGAAQPRDVEGRTTETTTPEFRNPADLDRTMTMDAAPSVPPPAMPAAPATNQGSAGIHQTVVAAMPQAPYTPASASMQPPSPQGSMQPPATPSLPPRPVPQGFQAPPPAEAPRHRALWALVGVGLVLFAVAAAFVASKL